MIFFEVFSKRLKRRETFCLWTFFFTTGSSSFLLFFSFFFSFGSSFFQLNSRHRRNWSPTGGRIFKCCTRLAARSAS